MKANKLWICAILVVFCTIGTSCEMNDPDAPFIPYEYGKSVGIFSISDYTQVTFSTGNLQYNINSRTWRFAEHQYDYIGKDNVSNIENRTGWIDLFGWGTGNDPLRYGSSYSDERYQTFVDWGTNKMGDDAPNTWRTLTEDEWMYIVEGRKHAKKLCAPGIINGVQGLIILPDNFSKPSSVSWKTKSNWQRYYYWDVDNEYTIAEWSLMQARGAVFLPASGIYNYYSDIHPYEDSSSPAYWSCTEFNRMCSWAMFFADTSYPCTYAGIKNTGYAVRLVKNLH